MSASLESAFIAGKEVYPRETWAPEFSPGERVIVQVNLKNIGSEALKLWTSLYGTVVNLQKRESWSPVSPGQTYGFSFDFNMPDVDPETITIDFGHIKGGYQIDGTVSFVLSKRKLAPSYERTHFIGHALWAPKLTRDQLLPYATDIEKRIEAETGFSAFVRDIQIRHFPPFKTDIDFVIDVPIASPIAPLVIAGIIAICVAVVVVAVFLWWTVWVEKSKLYYCEQCPDTPSFQGWDIYMGHLKDVHPEKYEGAKEAGAKPWWGLFGAGAGIGIGIVLILAVMAMGRREKE